MSVLTKVLCRCKKLDQAFEVCDEMASKYNFKLNVHVYSNLVQGCIFFDEVDRAFKVLERMASEKVRVDVRIYTLLSRACVASKRVEDTIGLVRAGLGLRCGPPSLAAFGPAGAKLQGPARFPTDLLVELLRGITSLASSCRRLHGN